MRISRRHTADDWRSLDLSNEQDWQTAGGILEDRLQSRYLEHVRVLLRRKTGQFAALALDAALIECLEQFRRGVGKTPNGKGAQYFQTFLTETAFRDHFTAETARLFYRTIRCGLLHQGETTRSSRIKRRSDLPLVTATKDRKGLVLNARLFHEKLEQVVRRYLDELRTPGSTESRRAFRRKMNFICRMEEAEVELPPLAQPGQGLHLKRNAG